MLRFNQISYIILARRLPDLSYKMKIVIKITTVEVCEADYFFFQEIINILSHLFDSKLVPNKVVVMEKVVENNNS